MKLFDIGFPDKHRYFKTCLATRQNGVENRDKANSWIGFRFTSIFRFGIFDTNLIDPVAVFR